MSETPKTAGIREFAKHRGCSPAWISRLCALGTLTKDAAGRLNIVEADSILNARREVAHPGRLEANARQERARRTRPNAPADVTIDPTEADAALAAQPVGLANLDRVARTSAEKLAARFEERMAAAQAAIVADTANRLRSACPGGATEAQRVILGTFYGRFAELLAVERLTLEREASGLLNSHPAP